MITDNTTSTITIHTVEGRNDLYCHYSPQCNPQDCYIWLDGHDVGASYNSEIGNAIPMDVWHGTTRRYFLRFVLSGQAANNLMEYLTPILQRVADGLSEEWDGSNYVGCLTDDAMIAESEIERMIDKWLDEDDALKVWDASDWYQNDTALDLGIRADMTNEECAVLAENLEQDALDSGDVDVLNGMGAQWVMSKRDEMEN
jgi:hypothetical protein